MFILLNAYSIKAGKAEVPIFTCPQGYILLGENCRSINQIDAVPYCNDDDADLVDGKCHKYADKIASCDIGKFDEGSGLCVEESVTPPFVLCPDDYVLVSGPKKDDKEDGKHEVGYCEKAMSVDGPLVCPWGTQQEGNRCASYNKVTPFWNCPEGTQPNGHFCMFTEEYDCSKPAAPISKKGENKRRLGEKDEDLKIYQPGLAGFGQDQIVSFGRTCVKETSVAAVMQCPKGSFQRDTDCVIVTYYEPEESKGHLMYESAPARAVCPGDYEFCDTHKTGGMCCKIETEKPYTQCPNYYSQRGDECVHVFDPMYICATPKKLRKGNVCDGYDWLPATVTMTLPVDELKKKKKVDLHVEHVGKH